ncbi:MAG: alpha/beta hydrolase [Acidovorax sp.]|uniref:alpha/beta fold hydrolase n=1 Tax=Acidovorax sp. TaxID=1872122 RepID=UPI0039E50659
MHTQQPAPRYASANGMQLAYDTFGDPSAPALLLVMGLGTQMIAWDESFCEQLAAQGYHVIRFDNRDIGLSTRLTLTGVPNIPSLLLRALAGRSIREGSVPYTLRDMAADAIGLLDALGIERAHVVGASMGGAIGQEMALRYPQRVISLTSIMATSGGRGLPGPRADALGLLLQPAPRDRTGYVKRHQRAMRVLRGTASPDEVRQDAERAERTFARSTHPEGFKRQFAAILASGSRRERLSTLRVPTLVIHGDSDPLVPLACGEDVARAVPGARMLVVPGMGHALPPRDWPVILDAITQHTRHNGLHPEGKSA